MRIGTRGSALALAQARWVADRLPMASEIVTITTRGDANRAIGDKSRWIAELEAALLAGEIDLAVHSAKDVPTELGDGLELVAIPPRADPADVICGAPSLAALPEGARIGTSSLRRTAQIAANRPDLEIVELRGNVDTRLRKLADGECEAIVLACAGLDRLERSAAIGGRLPEFVPAAGQGALAIEARSGAFAPGELAAIEDVSATAAVTAERAVVHALGASCHTPVGAHAEPVSAEELELRTWIGLPDGSAWLADRVTAPPDDVGRLAAERLLAAGAADLLRQAERMAPA